MNSKTIRLQSRCLGGALQRDGDRGVKTIYAYIYVCMYIYIYTHTYIHMYREREIDR